MLYCLAQFATQCVSLQGVESFMGIRRLEEGRLDPGRDHNILIGPSRIWDLLPGGKLCGPS